MHLKIHIVNKHRAEYQCNVCNKELGSNYNLKRHIAKVHTNIVNYGETYYSMEDHVVIVAKKSFACDCCTKTYSRKADVKRHERMYHRKTQLIDGETTKINYGDGNYRTFNTENDMDINEENDKNEDMDITFGGNDDFLNSTTIYDENMAYDDEKVMNVTHTDNENLPTLTDSSIEESLYSTILLVILKAFSLNI